jgi:hypothetical protein
MRRLVQSREYEAYSLRVASSPGLRFFGIDVVVSKLHRRTKLILTFLLVAL